MHRVLLCSLLAAHFSLPVILVPCHVSTPPLAEFSTFSKIIKKWTKPLKGMEYLASASAGGPGPRGACHIYGMFESLVLELLPRVLPLDLAHAPSVYVTIALVTYTEGETGVQGPLGSW